MAKFPKFLNPNPDWIILRGDEVVKSLISVMIGMNLLTTCLILLNSHSCFAVHAIDYIETNGRHTDVVTKSKLALFTYTPKTSEMESKIGGILCSCDATVCRGTQSILYMTKRMSIGRRLPARISAASSHDSRLQFEAQEEDQRKLEAKQATECQCK